MMHNTEYRQQVQAGLNKTASPLALIKLQV